MLPGILLAEDSSPKAFINGIGPGWRALTEEDFTNVNCKEDTWTFEKDGLIKCTGRPVGVIRTKKMVTNLELVVQWRHLRNAGNSGVFLWATPESIKKLAAGQGRLPAGIEVQNDQDRYPLDGRNLWEELRGQASIKPPDEYLVTGTNGVIASFDEQWKLVKLGDGTDELMLFELEESPNETSHSVIIRVLTG